MLARTLILIAAAIIIICEAAIIAVMKDNAQKASRAQMERDHLFHKWLIIWAAVNTAILVVGSWILTGSVFGLGS